MAVVFQPLTPALAKSVSAESNSGNSVSNSGNGGGGGRKRRRKGGRRRGGSRS